VKAGSQGACGGPPTAEARFVAADAAAQRARQREIRQEEIFGPVLPILTFESLDAVDRGHQRGAEAAGAVRVDEGRRTIDALKTNTSSGSLCVNLCLQQFAQHNLPFGGVNTSGMGNAHGFFGFKAFSHERAMMSAGPLSALKLLFPPYDAGKRRLSELLIKYGT
jgi:aldehyde dehydrogenase (NAD+)